MDVETEAEYLMIRLPDSFVFVPTASSGKVGYETGNA
jgi:hypothetical protein